MSYLTRFSPFRAVRDLRFFLAQRQPHELIFLFLAMLITGLLIAGFARDSQVARPYKRNIIYVEQWPASRTDAEIRAQQAIDGPIKQKALDAQKAREKALQDDFKKLDDRLKAYGL